MGRLFLRYNPRKEDSAGPSAANFMSSANALPSCTAADAVRCDVIIPVYNQPHWVVRCVAQLYRTTPAEALGEIFLVDDGSDATTRQCLEQIAQQRERVRLLRHEKRKGFAHAVNTALERSTAPYVLLLNSDCLLTPGAIPKLVAHCRKDASIGLISPFSNNSPPLTVPMLEGSHFQMMNRLLERLFPGQCREACTIVGSALVITRPCLEATGLFQQWHGFGYGEETDYQFRAAQRGYRAMAAMDTYVYHAGNQSFAADPDAPRTRMLNHREFHERWGRQYRELAARVPPEAAANEIREALERKPATPAPAVMFVLPTLDDRIGGTHTVADICNAAALEDLDFQLATLRSADRLSWNLPLYFAPVTFASVQAFLLDTRFQPAAFVATSWDTVGPVMLRSASRGVPWVYFVQGYESYFEDGRVFGAFQDTLRQAEEVVTTSGWLREMAQRHCGRPIEILPIGFDDTVFFPSAKAGGRGEPRRLRICAMARGSLAKGQPFLMEILDRLSACRDRFSAVLLHPPDLEIPAAWKGFCEPRELPVLRPDLAEILRGSDLFLDTSLHEGFGLAPLEAMACGCVVVASASGGVSEYLEDGVNGVLVREVNQPQAYVDEILRLSEDRERLGRLRAAALETAARFRGSERYAAFARRLQEKAAAAATRADRSQRPESLGLRRMAKAFEMLCTDYVGMDTGQNVSGLESRVSRLEMTVNEILTSRIWRTLRAAGGVLLAIAGALGSIRKRLGLTGSRP